MDRKQYYTIGQLAEVAGVSAKALRIYEEKSLLIPTAYSEKNYRMYDEDAKMKLQKIIMFKYLGYSLEQTKELLDASQKMGIRESFEEQLAMLECKKKQVETAIHCVRKAIREYENNDLNMNEFFDTIQYIVKDRKFDNAMDFGRFSSKHAEWSTWIFEQAIMHNGMSVLDAGCGYGNLWRKNLDRLPKNMSVACVDKHNSWADDFERVIVEKLAGSKMKGVEFHFVWEDLEDMKFEKQYDRIFFNHVISFIKEPERLLHKFKESLKEDGMLICTWGGQLFMQEVNTLICGFDPKITLIQKKLDHYKETLSQHEKMLDEYFASVERRTFQIELRYEHAEECYNSLIGCYENLETMVMSQKQAFLQYLKKVIDEKGAIIIKKDTYLYRCGGNR